MFCFNASFFESIQRDQGKLANTKINAKIAMEGAIDILRERESSSTVEAAEQRITKAFEDLVGQPDATKFVRRKLEDTLLLQKERRESSLSENEKAVRVVFYFCYFSRYHPFERPSIKGHVIARGG